MQIQRKLLTFPIYDAVKWCLGLYANTGERLNGTLTFFVRTSILLICLISDNIEVIILSQSNASRDSCPHSVIVYSIKPAKCSFPEWIDRPNDDKLLSAEKPPPTIKQFFLALIKGEAMGFMQPKQMPI